MILLVDGNNVLSVRNHGARLSTREGFPTQAIYGFFDSLRSYVKIFKPSKVFVVWDGGHSKRRKAIFPEYKANREEKTKTPQEEMLAEELKLQRPIIQEAVVPLGVTSVFGWGVEGDDLIALLVRAARKNGKPAVIVSNDKDFHQLIGPDVSIYKTVDAKERHITNENMEAIYGLKPAQWLDYRAITGDASDNIGGVKGAGEKTARELLKEFGSIENFRKAMEGIKKIPARRRYILENAEIIERNKALMNLTDLEADFKGVKIEYTGPDWKALKAFFIKYEFKEMFLDFFEWVSPFQSLRTVGE